MSEVFRTRIAPQEPETAPEQPAEVKGIVDDPSKLEVFKNDSSELDKWEITNGKYGLEYMGISEIAKEFPMKMHFQMIDKYIKEEMGEYDKTPKKWQDILKRLETETGSKELNAVDKLKKLAGYIQVLNKLKKAKTLKDKFLNSI